MSQPAIPTLDGYTFKKLIGGGAFGKVYLAVDSAGRTVAIKKINKAKSTDTAQARREVQFLKILNDHENVIKLYDLREDDHYFYLVMEYAENGELFDFVAGGMREDIALFYFRQLVSALEYLHSHQICHRDLKLENILLNSSYTMKMCDFGLSHTFDGSQTLRTMCGSPAYVAPEVYKGQGYDGMKADIWSAGIILCALVAATLPVEDRAVDSDPLFMKLKRREFDYDPWGVTLTGYAADLCKKMLDPNPATRIGWTEIKNHPWYLGASLDTGLPIPIMELEPYMKSQKEISMQDEILSGETGSGAPSDIDAPVFNAPGARPIRRRVPAPRVPGELPNFEDEAVVSRPTMLLLPPSETPQGIFERLDYVVGSERRGVLTVDRDNFRVKIKMPEGPSGRKLSFLVSLYRHRKGIVVEFTRTKGDTMQFHRLFKEIKPSLE